MRGASILKGERGWRASCHCPVCGNFDTGGKGRKPRCVGWQTSNPDIVYCSIEESPYEKENLWGKKVYRHYIGEEEETALKEKRLSRIASSLPTPFPPLINEYSRESRQVVEEVVNYPGQGPYRPACTKTWFVVRSADGAEITRSLNKKEAEKYVLDRG